MQTLSPNQSAPNFTFPGEQPSECGIKQHGWSPYTINGGTACAIAGKKSAILVADTRMSEGLSIHTRKGSKIAQLTSKIALCSCGMKADAIALQKRLTIAIEMYKHEHKKEPSVKAVAQLLSTVLYSKRFFPYYAFNILAGYDEENKCGVCYHYDAIGNFESVPYTTSGSGSSLAHPVLDSLLSNENKTQTMLATRPEPSETQLIDWCKDVLSSTGERDIYTGDAVEIFVIGEGGCNQYPNFALKKD